MIHLRTEGVKNLAENLCRAIEEKIFTSCLSADVSAAYEPKINFFRCCCRFRLAQSIYINKLSIFLSWQIPKLVLFSELQILYTAVEGAHEYVLTLSSDPFTRFMMISRPQRDPGLLYTLVHVRETTVLGCACNSLPAYLYSIAFISFLSFVLYFPSVMHF